jgi:hypothetical protein
MKVAIIPLKLEIPSMHQMHHVACYPLNTGARMQKTIQQTRKEPGQQLMMTKWSSTGIITVVIEPSNWIQQPMWPPCNHPQETNILEHIT